MAAASASTDAKRQIRQALDRWKGSLGEAELPLFRAFVEDLVGRIRGPFFSHHAALSALEHLEVAFRFALERRGDEQRVEIRGGAKKGAVVLTSMPDQAFIVDTTRLFLKRCAASYWGGFNVVYHPKRDANGRLVGFLDGGEAEAIGYVECDEGQLFGDVAASTALLREHLVLARATSVDFKAMTRTIERAIERFEAAADQGAALAEANSETAHFLKWLLRENFVFMGLSGFGEPLGIERVDSRFKGVTGGEWPPAHPPGYVSVRKSGIESPVHRAGRIDEILVAMPSGESMLVRGMFTYRAITQPSRNVPILRNVLGGILQNAQSRPGSYRYKGIANVFDSLPTEFLFTATAQAIEDMTDLVFEAEQQQEVGVTFLMMGPSAASCVLAMPKSQYNEDLCEAVEEDIRNTLSATYSDRGVFFGRYDTVLLHYYLTGVNYPGDQGVRGMTERIRERATPFVARLWHAIAAKQGEAVADRLVDVYGQAFPEALLRQQSFDRCLADIARFEMLTAHRTLVADVFAIPGTDGGSEGLGLSLYQTDDVYLTAIVPVLDAFGLVVVDSQAFDVKPKSGKINIDTFHLDPKGGVGRDAILANRERLLEALAAVFAGDVESDRLNQLVLTAGLTWQEVDVVRGLARYSRQLGIKLAIVRVQEILLSNPHIATLLVDLFHTKFDPDRNEARAERTAAAETAVRDALRKLRGYDEDHLFRALLELMTGMIRTNYYRTDRPFHYLSFKFLGANVPMMGARRPMFEIYVHNLEVEGVHLRFGKVARGGLRWSDREDFRTEVLGLVSTQQVKNVVIVPEGAKGGFFLKRPARDMAARRQQADRLYQTFVRGLLDLTDNGAGGKITKPPRVFAYDGDDPYLVVAADKGTAHMSDTANKLSLGYGHWLGDAFASGGSVGYDHKKVGITARGGWVLVARHFREMGKDPYKEEFSCVGIGDLSGDVFGNGLIESDKTRLFAAFNHVHIFLDPNPDAATSAVERMRLFKAERLGGWENYDRTKISKGGGVFDRTAKSVPLSPQVQGMLGIHADEAEPEVVIKAILLMDVDLLWNGGIGTYVKASTETHADADDRSCDNIRIDGNQIRAKIVGEGGNLGCTQRGRIEAALNGVRINTDAIDNSGGVDMSDHEVNLKILLDRIVERGEMTLPGRNELLARMTDEVAVLVLANNDAHGQQLSRDQVRSQRDVFSFGRAIAFVEERMGTTRDALRLPTDKELARRAETGAGLTRPELSVLSAWVKMYVYRELVAGNPKALPGFDDLLLTYFPTEAQKSHVKDIRNHMLGNEIAMTVATTRMIADAGAAFFPIMVETTGCTVGQIAEAYLKAQELAGVSAARAGIEANALGAQQLARYEAWVKLDEGVREVAAWWLSTRGEVPKDAELTKMAGAAATVIRSLPGDMKAAGAAENARWLAAGLDERTVGRVQEATLLPLAVMAHAEALRNGSPLGDVVVRQLAVARASRLQDVLDDLATRPATGRWDPIALEILYDRYAALLQKLVSVVPVPTPVPSVDVLVATLSAGALAPVRAQVDALIGKSGTPSIPTLIVLEERVAGRIARITEQHH